MIKIVDATYGTKNVTKILENNLINDEIYFKADNGIFGDPNPGVLKKLIVNYTHDNISKKIEIVEGDFIKIPQTNTNKLGIFYTNNNVDEIVIKKSLQTIYKASKKHNVDILTCPWFTISGNPFKEIISSIKIGNHFNINYQILILLLTAKKTQKYKYVSFLEHDVLYGEDYFNYPEFDSKVISNNNYIGFKEGFQPNNNKSQQPLHELTMEFDFAVEHFSKNLANNVVDMALLEPQGEIQPFKEWTSLQPSIHVFHGRHITSHYSIYSNNVYTYDKYWGNYKDLLVI